MACFCADVLLRTYSLSGLLLTLLSVLLQLTDSVGTTISAWLDVADRDVLQVSLTSYCVVYSLHI